MFPPPKEEEEEHLGALSATPTSPSSSYSFVYSHIHIISLFPLVILFLPNNPRGGKNLSFYFICEAKKLS